MFELSNYKDIGSDIYPYVAQYYAYLDKRDYASAYAYLSTNKDKLKSYLVNADSFNKIEKGIYTVASKQQETQQVIVSNTEPNVEYVRAGSYWIKPLS